MLLSEVPAWVWQVLGAVGGLTLGLGLGALHLRRSNQGRRRAAPRTDAGRPTTLSAPSTLSGPASGLPSQFRQAGGDTPQQRLLEHLRQSNLDLNAQLRASAAQHGRLVKDKDDEVATLKADYDQRVEELRQTHSQELKHLMTLLVEQVDGIHKAHANHVKALEAEIDRIRLAQRRGARADEPETTTFAATEAMTESRRPH